MQVSEAKISGLEPKETCPRFALSASWDKTMRLWDLNVGQSVRSFVGHTSDVTGLLPCVRKRNTR